MRGASGALTRRHVTQSPTGEASQSLISRLPAVGCGSTGGSARWMSAHEGSLEEDLLPSACSIWKYPAQSHFGTVQVT